MKSPVHSLAAIALLAAAAGAHAQAIDPLHNERTVMTAQWGPGVSKNPYLQFTLRGAKAGDRVAIVWNDNRGATRRDEAAVA